MPWAFWPARASWLLVRSRSPSWIKKSKHRTTNVSVAQVRGQQETEKRPNRVVMRKDLGRRKNKGGLSRLGGGTRQRRRIVSTNAFPFRWPQRGGNEIFLRQ